MIKYKLTNQAMRTHNGFQWELGKEFIIENSGAGLCSDQVFHYYDSPLLAVLFNPIHADISNPRLFEVDCDPVAHDGLKGGSKRMKLLNEIILPEITTEQKIKFAILCSKQVYKDAEWNAWADKWLSGEDRSAASVWAAAEWAAVTAVTAARAAEAAAEEEKIDLVKIAEEACAA